MRKGCSQKSNRDQIASSTSPSAPERISQQWGLSSVWKLKPGGLTAYWAGVSSGRNRTVCPSPPQAASKLTHALHLCSGKQWMFSLGRACGLWPRAHTAELTADQRQLIRGTTGFSPSYILRCWLLGLTHVTLHKTLQGIMSPVLQTGIRRLRQQLVQVT